MTHSWTVQGTPKSAINQPKKSRGRSELSCLWRANYRKAPALQSSEKRKHQTWTGKLLSDTEPYSELFSGCGGRQGVFPCVQLHTWCSHAKGGLVPPDRRLTDNDPSERSASLHTPDSFPPPRLLQDGTWLNFCSIVRGFRLTQTTNKLLILMTTNGTKHSFTMLTAQLRGKGKVRFFKRAQAFWASELKPSAQNSCCYFLFFDSSTQRHKMNPLCS